MLDILAVTAAILLLFLLVYLRTPIFIALGSSGLVGLLLLEGPRGIEQIPIAFVSQLESYALVAAPMYILMGEILAAGGLGRAIFRFAHAWLGRLPGGLGVTAVGSSTVFGALSGVSLSAVTVVGRMSVPEMLERGYRPSFATGAVVASGALAMLIPPSLMFILYSSVSGVSIGALFAGGIVPGLVLATLMALFVLTMATLKPEIAPRAEEGITWKQRLDAMVKVAPALILIIIVLGSIYTGIATATEAAAIGAIGAFLVVGVFDRALTWTNIKKILIHTTQISGALLIIVGSAFVFTQMLVVVRAAEALTTFVGGLSIPPSLIVIILLIIVLGLGCLIDAASLMLVITPILLPIFESLGYDPLWVGVILVVTLETAVITPPVGLNLYAMKSVVPQVDIGDIIRGALPYLAIEFGLVILMVFVPEIATWFPSLTAT
ncbi:TRAP transporter large permease [Brevibacterium jeotgali]|uniref:TRAP transporter, DctM subunit n=1 Tax=Brevibacterium jeotgali TaxID=1262550 RepID=A0A2H1L2H3_9MICO|nr:TRAP transporter large permease [Brevibacterium jeotgali]TWC03074.1 tripartite ATP-independent transporter DctM subunit [Brevibacterium jeotgali]SMY11097.1 TRAP transporter, DctM subunit [Brevibacterium jeotgali]